MQSTSASKPIAAASDPLTDSSLRETIASAKHIWLTTHRQADGDGLACEVATHAALLKLGKRVKILNFEAPAGKYRFLFEQATGRPISVTVFDPDLGLTPPDLILVFDTNDLRLIEPLAGWAKERGVSIGILDHHQGAPPSGSPTMIDTSAASSGEVLLTLFDEMQIELDAAIATPLYASLVFDTQNFRFIRGSANSHAMAARLLPKVREPERIHEALFANLTPSKLGFLASALSLLRIEAEGTLAVVVLPLSLFKNFGADAADSGDVIDMALNVSSVKVALLLRQESSIVEAGQTEWWKISLRSKRGFNVVTAAEAVGGGGHTHAAGATVSGDPQTIEERIRPLLLAEIRRAMAR